jgi:hypothetical protein
VIKQVFIPLVVLGQQRGDWLELYVESCRLHSSSCFAQLAASGLDNGIALAEKALAELKLKPANSMIYTANAQPLLSNTLGTAAGLVLASIISSKSCPYQTLIVNAVLKDDPARDYPLNYNGFWLEKLAAILALPKQPDKTPLILAIDTPLLDEQREQLLARNIQPVLMANLKQALGFCLNS